MQRIRTMLFAFCFALFAFASCSKKNARKEIESNDRPSDAHFIDTSVIIEGAFTDALIIRTNRKTVTEEYKDDIDWYKIRVTGTEKQRLTLRLTTALPIDAYMTFYDHTARRALDAYDDYQGTRKKRTHAEGIDNLCVFPGTYYLRVAEKEDSDAYTNERAVAPYTLTVTITNMPEFLEAEINDSFESALYIDPSMTIEGRYTPARDPRITTNALLFEGNEVDMYTFFNPLNETLALNAEVTRVPKVDPVLILFNAQRERIAVIDAKGRGEGETLSGFTFLPETRYYLAVINGNMTPSKKSYTLRLMPSEYRSDYEYEPNNDFLTATRIGLGAPMDGRFNYKDDIDAYRFSVRERTGANIMIALTPEGGMDVSFEAFDAAGASLFVADSEGEGKREIVQNRFFPEGDYYLIVSYRNALLKERGYRLQANALSRANDREWEPNDTLQTATRILLNGSPITGYYADFDDVDYYKFVLENASVLAISLTPPKNGAARIALLDENGVTLSENESGKKTALAKGTYYLVTHAHKNANAVGEYTITVTRSLHREELQ